MENYVFIKPIFNLKIDFNKKEEIKIGRITFISQGMFARKYASILDKGNRNATIQKALAFILELGKPETFAYIIIKNENGKITSEIEKLFQDAIHFLAFSMHPIHIDTHKYSFGYIDRKIISKYLSSTLTANKLNANMAKNVAVLPFCLNQVWHDYAKNFAFQKTLDIVNSLPNPQIIQKDWANTIIEVCKLMGKANLNIDYKENFLLNMIALEMLLTSQGDKYSTELPKRIEAFIGWTENWRRDQLEKRIKELYYKRCNVVHNGKFDDINYDDYKLIQMINYNIILNIVKHQKYFPKKGAIVEFAKKLEARDLLGLKKIVKPKSFQFINVFSKELTLEELDNANL